MTGSVPTTGSWRRTGSASVPSRVLRVFACCSALVGLSSLAWAAGAPADRLPMPRPELCLEIDEDASMGSGLGYDDVTLALESVIQTALYCPKPAGFSELHLTYELVVGCNGIVSSIEVVETGGAPEAYTSCVSDVIAKADFPAHDLVGGVPITYPVNVAW